MIFKGYIDESYDGNQKLFALSCLVALGKPFSEMERMWKLHLNAKNKQLAKQGRPLITRYHASDCSNKRGEYEGWSDEERDAFVLGLFGIFKRTDVHTVGIDVDLDNLCEVFPEFAGDRLELAYSVMLDFVMYTVAEDFYKLNPARDDWKITLFHDRTQKHDATILRQFRRSILDPGFQFGNFFTSITSLSWRDCLLLQPADLVAYEIFKEAQLKEKGQVSRRSFKALIDMESFGIHTRRFVDKESMLKLRRLGEEKMRQREGENRL